MMLIQFRDFHHGIILHGIIFHAIIFTNHGSRRIVSISLLPSPPPLPHPFLPFFLHPLHLPRERAITSNLTIIKLMSTLCRLSRFKVDLTLRHSKINIAKIIRASGKHLVLSRHNFTFHLSYFAIKIFSLPCYFPFSVSRTILKPFLEWSGLELLPAQHGWLIHNLGGLGWYNIHKPLVYVPFFHFLYPCFFPLPNQVLSYSLDIRPLCKSARVSVALLHHETKNS